MLDKIKDWAKEDQPRQKLIAKGPQFLTDSELIAVLLGSGTKDKSAVTVGKELLQSSGNNLDTLGRMSMKEIKKIKGVGEARSVVILAALELGRRRQSSSSEKKIIRSSADIFDYIGPLLGDLNHEQFWVILLHKSLQIIESKMLFSGGYDAVIADVRMIMKYAIENNAVAMVVAHNHPSGNTSPSKADIDLTQNIIKACTFLNISLIDHIIVCGNNNFFSFADSDMM
jgi:DNA repair protein RadC